MDEPEPTASPAVRASASRRGRAPRPPGLRRATVVGAGSFGTALAVLLTRGGLRTTLQTRTAEQAAAIESDRENRAYLPGVELPEALRIEPASAGAARADYVFIAVPSRTLGEAIDTLVAAGLSGRAAIVSVAKGLVPPAGEPPTIVLSSRFGAERVACLGGPAHAREMVRDGAALVAAAVRGGAGALARADLHPCGGGLRAVQRPRRSGARGGGEERRRARGGSDRGTGAERGRVPRRGTSSPRSGATPRGSARARSR